MHHKIEEETEYEKLRAKNIAENEAMLKRLFPVSPLLKRREEKTQKMKSFSKKGERLAQMHPYTTSPTRKNPSRFCRGRKRYRYGSDCEEEERSSDYEPEEASDCEEEFKPSGMIVNLWGTKSGTNKAPSKRRSPKKTIIDRDDLLQRYNLLTEDDLNLVAEKTSEKNYDQNGSSCHQCRQKTDDLKTLCRSPSCFGIRGQFCGPCLRNRYGEDAKAAIMDKNWTCPPCRGICNCSFCMAKRGRRATGILIHIAKEKGYQSVRSFLGD